MKYFSKILFGLLILSIIPLLVFGQTCPKGKTEPCTGECGLFVDENGNNVCDNSEQATPELVSDSPQEAKFVKPIIKDEKPKTNFVKIWLLSWVVYIILGVWVKRGKFSAIAQKKIFNALLTVSFSVCAITSFAYLLRADYGYDLGIPYLYQLHLESGIWLIGLGIAHALWHIAYYQNLFKKS
jgi:hypothetical protein